MSERSRFTARLAICACLGLSACGEQLPREQTLEELMAGWQAIHTTDLSIHVHASPSPVKAGGQLLYAFSVRNPTNPTDRTVAVVTLPGQVTYALGDEACSAAGSIVTCELGGLPANSSRPWALLVNVPAGAAGQMLTSQVTVRHYYQAFNSTELIEGPDPNLKNNTAQVTLSVQ